MKEKETVDGKDVKVIKFNSKQDYEEFYLKHQNISHIRGVFDKDNTFGQIQMSTFSISIKSLVTPFSY